MQQYERLGGLSAYAVDRRKVSFPAATRPCVKALMSALKTAIRSGPVTHAGGSLETGQIFGYERGGTIVVSASLWSELCLMRHWIQDALILRWAEKTSELSMGSVRPEAVVSQLLVTPDPEREVQAAREIFAKLRAANVSGPDVSSGMIS